MNRAHQGLASSHTGTSDSVAAMTANARSWPKISLLAVLAGALLAVGAVASGLAATSTVYKQRDGSMEPTLLPGTRVVLKAEAPVLGAIVVVHPPLEFQFEMCGPRPHRLSPGGASCDTPVPQESSFETARRIVAGPGDELYVRGGHVYRKAAGAPAFTRESDPYTRACGSVPECSFPTPIKIPAGHWFMMGDNRGESNDSRYWGPVPTGWIVGTVVQIIKRH